VHACSILKYSNSSSPSGQGCWVHNSIVHQVLHSDLRPTYWSVPLLQAKLTPLHFDHQGGLMEQSSASLTTSDSRVVLQSPNYAERSSRWPSSLGNFRRLAKPGSFCSHVGCLWDSQAVRHSISYRPGRIGEITLQLRGIHDTLAVTALIMVSAIHVQNGN
jgi:hypothetical protein